jgi:hypothetical protein
MYHPLQPRSACSVKCKSWRLRVDPSVMKREELIESTAERAGIESEIVNAIAGNRV